MLWDFFKGKGFRMMENIILSPSSYNKTIVESL